MTKEVLTDQIDMTLVEVFLINIHYITSESTVKIEMVSVIEETDIKKLIAALRAKDKSVVLESRIRNIYDDEDATIEYFIQPFEIEEVKIIAMVTSTEEKG